MNKRTYPFSLLCSIMLLSYTPGWCIPRTGRNLLKGRLDNVSGLSLQLFYTDRLQESKVAEIPLINGEFSIPDSLVAMPQIASLSFTREGSGFNLPVALAGNYTLSLKANTLNYETFCQSVEWAGAGAPINQFYTAMSNLRIFYDDRVKADFDDWYRQSRSTSDSLFICYSKKYHDRLDPEFGFFKNIIREDILFKRLDALMTHACRMLDKTSPLEVKKYVDANSDRSVLRNISDPHYLACPSYRDLVGFSYSYLFYLFKYDRKLHPDTTRNVYQTYLDKIVYTFYGPVRDYVLFRFIDINLLSASNSYDKFHLRAQLTRPFLSKIANGHYRSQLSTGIDKKEAELAILNTGDPAPSFSLTDSSGSPHSLSEYAGKIIVLDFWASWCSPCRHETPYLRALSDRYKTDSRIAFISIAVRDPKRLWLKALQEDKPSWLQLFDGESKTAGEYFTNAIPKFVIIDGKGRIVNFDTPGPSEGDKMESILKAELEKM